MSSPTVYLGGPILGNTVDTANRWRYEFAKRLELRGITGISPLRCEPSVAAVYQASYEGDEKFGSKRAIFSKNVYDVKRCDLVLCYFPMVPASPIISTGTTCEAAMAYAWGKPVVLVSHLECVVDHPVLTGCASWILRDLDEAFDLCVGILDGYRPGGKNV